MRSVLCSLLMCCLTDVCFSIDRIRVNLTGRTVHVSFLWQGANPSLENVKKFSEELPEDLLSKMPEDYSRNVKMLTANSILKGIESTSVISIDRIALFRSWINSSDYNHLIKEEFSKLSDSAYYVLSDEDQYSDFKLLNDTDKKTAVSRFMHMVDVSLTGNVSRQSLVVFLAAHEYACKLNPEIKMVIVCNPEGEPTMEYPVLDISCLEDDSLCHPFSSLAPTRLSYKNINTN